MNSRGYTVTSIAIAFMAVTLLSVPGFGGNAYAEHTNVNINEELVGTPTEALVSPGMSLSVDANAGSHSIMVSGTTDRSDPVMIIVTAPNGNVVAIDQITPSGHSYSATIGVGGSQYSQDGMYTISAKQGDASMYNVSTEVEIVDGHVIPEFGVIAAMILAVAIVSIIVVTAKTRLSIVPRY